MLPATVTKKSQNKQEFGNLPNEQSNELFMFLLIALILFNQTFKLLHEYKLFLKCS